KALAATSIAGGFLVFLYEKNWLEAIMQSLEASHPDVQVQVATLQAYITENFYTCTKEILQGLGLMYVEDERFSANIDRAGGPGTASFVSQAIAIYCQE
uniref:TipAS antibiotic-recognition domain-containing protein n=1 Tax=Streptococcus suis TaxID=1307 RepID=UPI000AFA0D64